MWNKYTCRKFDIISSIKQLSFKSCLQWQKEKKKEKKEWIRMLISCGLILKVMQIRKGYLKWFFSLNKKEYLLKSVFNQKITEQFFSISILLVYTCICLECSCKKLVMYKKYFRPLVPLQTLDMKIMQNLVARN